MENEEGGVGGEGERAEPGTEWHVRHFTHYSTPVFLLSYFPTFRAAYDDSDTAKIMVRIWVATGALFEKPENGILFSIKYVQRGQK